MFDDFGSRFADITDSATIAAYLDMGVQFLEESDTRVVVKIGLAQQRSWDAAAASSVLVKPKARVMPIAQMVSKMTKKILW